MTKEKKGRQLSCQWANGNLNHFNHRLLQKGCVLMCNVLLMWDCSSIIATALLHIHVDSPCIYRARDSKDCLCLLVQKNNQDCGFFCKFVISLERARVILSTAPFSNSSFCSLEMHEIYPSTCRVMSFIHEPEIVWSSKLSSCFVSIAMWIWRTKVMKMCSWICFHGITSGK